MRIVVIGGTGHVGTYMVPRLVEGRARGHRRQLASGNRISHTARGEAGAGFITADRTAEEAAGSFGKHVHDLRPDVVIDMICFTLESAQHLVEALRGDVQHFLHCGTIWVHGPSVVPPTKETQPPPPVRRVRHPEGRDRGLPAGRGPARTFRPPSCTPATSSAPGWAPLIRRATSTRGSSAHWRARRGLRCPTSAWRRCTTCTPTTWRRFHPGHGARSSSVGESFHVVSPAAVTLARLRRSDGAVGSGTRPRSLPAVGGVATNRDRTTRPATWDHIAHSPNCSIDKARRLIGYQPRYSSLQGVYEAVSWLIAHEVIEI